MWWIGHPNAWLSVALGIILLQTAKGFDELLGSSHFISHSLEARSLGGGNSLEARPLTGRSKRQVAECDTTMALFQGQSVLIYSDNNGKKEKCKYTIQHYSYCTEATTGGRAALPFLANYDQNRLSPQGRNLEIANGSGGSRLQVECPNFFFNPRGCKRERMLIKEPGVPGKDKFCNDNPITTPYTSRGSSIIITYIRKRLRNTQCSGGFVCKVSAV